MAYKTFQVEELGEIAVYKRKGTRSLRLSIRADNSVRVTIPPWMNYASGVTFAQSRAAWIQTHSRPVVMGLTHHQAIGKAHHLIFIADAQAKKVKSRISGSEIRIYHPTTMSLQNELVQSVARRAAIRALRQQAEMLLPTRLQELANRYGLTYRSLTIKQLQTRWGSCDQSQNIALNLFLLQLPWELIDYVILHELTHTIVLQHGPKFWQTMAGFDPKTPSHRKAIREYRAAII